MLRFGTEHQPMAFVPFEAFSDVPVRLVKVAERALNFEPEGGTDRCRIWAEVPSAGGLPARKAASERSPRLHVFSAVPIGEGQ
jgi:hypothetical protein